MVDGQNLPAFPQQCADALDVGMVHEGMSLRDYFAVHADQPGISELVSMAGGETDGFFVKFNSSSAQCKFTDWWNHLPLSDRLSLSARVRYAMADALLAARQEPQS